MSWDLADGSDTRIHCPFCFGSPSDHSRKKGVIYPAFYHPESSISQHLCSHSTMINDSHNYDPNSQQVTKVSSESPKNGISWEVPWEKGSCYTIPWGLDTTHNCLINYIDHKDGILSEMICDVYHTKKLFNYIAHPLMFVKSYLVHPKWELMTILVWRMHEPIFHLVISKEITILGRISPDDRIYNEP